MTTGNNDGCIRQWYEVTLINSIFDADSTEMFLNSHKTWVPYNKGGSYRKWYGNLDYLIGYSPKFNDYMDTLGGHRHDNKQYYFRFSITWSLTNSNYFGARFRPSGSIFDVNGMSFYPNNHFEYFLGFMCSKTASHFMRINNPTLASNGAINCFHLFVRQNGYVNLDQTKRIEKIREIILCSNKKDEVIKNELQELKSMHMITEIRNQIAHNFLPGLIIYKEKAYHYMDRNLQDILENAVKNVTKLLVEYYKDEQDCFINKNRDEICNEFCIDFNESTKQLIFPKKNQKEAY